MCDAPSTPETPWCIPDWAQAKGTPSLCIQWLWGVRYLPRGQELHRRWGSKSEGRLGPSVFHFQAAVPTAWPLPCPLFLRHKRLLVLSSVESWVLLGTLRWTPLLLFSSSRPGGEAQWSGRKLEISKCPRKTKMTAKTRKARRRRSGEARSNECLLFLLRPRSRHMWCCHSTHHQAHRHTWGFALPVILVSKSQWGLSQGCRNPQTRLCGSHVE